MPGYKFTPEAKAAMRQSMIDLYKGSIYELRDQRRDRQLAREAARAARLEKKQEQSALNSSTPTQEEGSTAMAQKSSTPAAKGSSAKSASLMTKSTLKPSSKAAPVVAAQVKADSDAMRPTRAESKASKAKAAAPKADRNEVGIMLGTITETTYDLFRAGKMTAKQIAEAISKKHKKPYSAKAVMATVAFFNEARKQAIPTVVNEKTGIISLKKK